MQSSDFTPTPPATSSNDVLLLAVFVAAVIHAALILGLNFTAPPPQKLNKSLDIILVNVATEKPPEKANLLAPENQVGAGEKLEKSTPLEKKLPSIGESEAKPARIIPPQPVKTAPAKPVLTQHRPTQSIRTSPKPPVETPEPLQHRELSPESLANQIAQLGAEIRNKTQGADQTRIKFINSVNAHQYLAAQYIHDWQTKVERTGNLNYPETARKKGFTGKLIMDVGIKPDGSIYSIRITRTSGYPALDNAAKRIVRMSSPFAPLPQELLKELDVLVISRVWTFSDETGLSSASH
ncbi:MAG: energy transducer TonB [Gammaproteobacteria bacterium]